LLLWFYAWRILRFVPSSAACDATWRHHSLCGMARRTHYTGFMEDNISQTPYKRSITGGRFLFSLDMGFFTARQPPRLRIYYLLCVAPRVV